MEGPFITVYTVIPYLKKIQKYLDHWTNLLSSVDITNFSLKMSNFCYIGKYRKILFWILNSCFNKCGCNFDVAIKIGYYSLLKVKVLLNKGYDILISFQGVTSKNLLSESNHLLDEDIWSKSGNSSISMRAVIKKSLNLKLQ